MRFFSSKKAPESSLNIKSPLSPRFGRTTEHSSFKLYCWKLSFEIFEPKFSADVDVELEREVRGIFSGFLVYVSGLELRWELELMATFAEAGNVHFGIGVGV
ncbi:predicted protein [Sclerotinia sclerotiorum 1980 UF-70]|uniref:Uncharacterized protein n=1 Tax=Sclerotinia sclerotiorum (strain ATCC 18683 / 1980 / Ss-1) TaxID=665079 RepID=A7EZS2_SCLS1|nr:predicted protein [Sclerotinia sclerotiorum 1980 UF-70]EDN94964.1 predicted protein [Sclerotinia sclerotiorum 1980 UF-70]